MKTFWTFPRQCWQGLKKCAPTLPWECWNFCFMCFISDVMTHFKQPYLKASMQKGSLSSASSHGSSAFPSFPMKKGGNTQLVQSFMTWNSLVFSKHANVILTVKWCYRIINIWKDVPLTWNQGITINWSHRETPFTLTRLAKTVICIILDVSQW